ncbi:MAG: DUF3391 domain-containing protein [Desulfovibrio sp.]|nr:DUF3391 domain-containing protein [Desulfovibrio sp.]
MSVKRIPVSRLQPGMYVVNPGCSWVEEPLLYMQEGIIPDAQAISSIAGQGFTEAVYDPARSLTPAVPSPAVRKLRPPPFRWRRKCRRPGPCTQRQCHRYGNAWSRPLPANWTWARSAHPSRPLCGAWPATPTPC